MEIDETLTNYPELELELRQPAGITQERLAYLRFKTDFERIIALCHFALARRFSGNVEIAANLEKIKRFTEENLKGLIEYYNQKNTVPVGGLKTVIENATNFLLDLLDKAYLFEYETGIHPRIHRDPRDPREPREPEEKRRHQDYAARLRTEAEEFALMFPLAAPLVAITNVKIQVAENEAYAYAYDRNPDFGNAIAFINNYKRKAELRDLKEASHAAAVSQQTVTPRTQQTLDLKRAFEELERDAKNALETGAIVTEAQLAKFRERYAYLIRQSNVLTQDRWRGRDLLDFPSGAFDDEIEDMYMWMHPEDIVIDEFDIVDPWENFGL